MGSLFGLVSQIALASMALGLLTMLIWGCRMWWQRRPTRNGRARLTALAPRGGTRALTQPVTFALVLVTIAVGWLLPLLGVSLIGFLFIDNVAAAIAGRRARRASMA
jgi:uncharacterized iron-regulated membrane protein